MTTYKLSELIDVSILQKIQDSFSKYSGMAALIADANGVPVTKGSGFTGFCMNLTRKSTTGRKRCEFCDKNGALASLKSGKPAVYYCHAGLIDFSSPIIVQGEFIGSVIGGQVRPTEIDLKKLRQTAKELDINPDLYLRELSETKIKSMKDVKKSAVFLSNIASIISNMAYDNFIAMKNSQEMERAARTQTLFVTDMALKMKSSMTGWMNTVKSVRSQDIASSIKSDLDKIVKGGSETSSILTDFVDYIKMAEGDSNLSEIQYNIRNELPKTINLIENQTKSENIEYTYEIATSVPERLFGDYGRISQILTKLILGHIKRLKSGKIKIVASSFKASYSTMLEIAIIDTGFTYTESELEDIRQYFETGISALLEKSITKDSSYPMVAMLLKQLAGTIEIMNTINNETVFIFKVPQLEVMQE